MVKSYDQASSLKFKYELANNDNSIYVATYPPPHLTNTLLMFFMVSPSIKLIRYTGI